MISPNTEDVAGELVAPANAAGGVLFLGIDDTGAIRGIPPEHVDTVENWIVNVAGHRTEDQFRNEKNSRAAVDEHRMIN